MTDTANEPAGGGMSPAELADRVVAIIREKGRVASERGQLGGCPGAGGG